MKKLLSLLLVLILATTIFSGCEMSEKELDEAIQGDWYTKPVGGKIVFRFNFNDGNFTEYMALVDEDGDDVKAASGTYKIKGKKIKVALDFTEGRLGVTEENSGGDKTIVVKDGKVTKIMNKKLEYFRDDPRD